MPSFFCNNFIILALHKHTIRVTEYHSRLTHEIRSIPYWCLQPQCYLNRHKFGFRYSSCCFVYGSALKPVSCFIFCCYMLSTATRWRKSPLLPRAAVAVSSFALNRSQLFSSVRISSLMHILFPLHLLCIRCSYVGAHKMYAIGSYVTHVFCSIHITSSISTVSTDATYICIRVNHIKPVLHYGWRQTLLHTLLAGNCEKNKNIK